jgi:hypothetical protein
MVALSVIFLIVPHMVTSQNMEVIGAVTDVELLHIAAGDF